MQKHQSDALRARVFISCGQNRDYGEASVASQIKLRLTELGFDPYVAVEEQTLRGLKENIFDQLSKSEYFIFVDFMREPLGDTNPRVHRGSLFSHQELALASFLDIEVLALQEVGTKQDDGIFKFLQANAIPFSDRHLLSSAIADKIRERGWEPSWRNELVLERQPGQFHDAQRIVNSAVIKGARFFHIDVRNRHRIKTATNCYVYLEKITNLNTSVETPLKTIEFKWAGYTLPYAHIPPGKARQFDGFWVFHEMPTHLQFNVFSDATDYIPRLDGEGRYELSYLVLADNFPQTRASFILDLNKSLDLTTFAAQPSAL
jgi:hypothetical protein